MGGSESTEKKQQEKIKINHIKFKDVRLIKQEDIIRNTLSIEHDADFEIWEQKLNKVANIQDDILFFPKAYQYTRKAICGSSGIIQIDYDNYQYVLIDQLKNRQKVKRYFEELELWYLLYSLISASHHFQQINSKIGDVRPQNIFINEEGHIKIANKFSWPTQNTNYSKSLFDNQKTYLSPEQLISIKHGSCENFINIYKAQSFTIGITMLESAILHDLSTLYLPTKEFDFKKFNMYLKQWWSLRFHAYDEKLRQNTVKEYSDSLKLAIAVLCEIGIQQRMESEELYFWLKPFHNKIVELKPFEAGLPPAKNLQKYQTLLKFQKCEGQQNRPGISRGMISIGMSNKGGFSKGDFQKKENVNLIPNAKPQYTQTKFIHGNIANLPYGKMANIQPNPYEVPIRETPHFYGNTSKNVGNVWPQMARTQHLGIRTEKVFGKQHQSGQTWKRTGYNSEVLNRKQGSK